MNNIEVSSTISHTLKVLNFLGLVDSKDGIFFFELGWKLFHHLFTLLFVTSLLSRVFLSGNSEESIFLLDVGVVTFVQFFRGFKFISRQSSILDFFHELSSHSTSDNEEFLRINKNLKNFDKFSLGFVSGGVLALGCVGIVPLVSKEKILVLNVSFPLDWKNDSFSFWIAYLFVFGGCLYSVLFYSFSIMLWYLMLNCTIKYEILGNQLRRMGLITDKREKSEIQSVLKTKAKELKVNRQELYHKHLIEAIKSHRNINRIVDRFSECFEDLFFIQIGTGAVSICASIYSLAFNSTDDDITHAYFYVLLRYVLIFYSLFDTFIVMFLGNKIMESSDRLSYCLFESDWISQSPKSKKCIVIMAEALKQRQEIIICKLYPLNLETFTSILHGAYSLFNILQNFK